MIYLIVTCCINNKNGFYDYEHRRKLYMDNISSLLLIIEKDFKDKIHLIVVENNGKRETYLDELKCDVVYTNHNENNNKPDAELFDIKHVIQEYNINKEDFIIKITGRYKLLNNIFLQMVSENIENYDVFVKFFNVCTLQYMYDDCVLGLYSIKCKYFDSFYYTKEKSPETDFALFVRNNIEKDKIKEIDYLHLQCCFADDLRYLTV